MKVEENILKSVSAILVCRGKVLYVKRQNHLKVFPGYTSFPGGKVQAGDSSSNTSFFKDYDHQYLIGALERECKEELNLNLEEEFKNKNLKFITFLTQAITPSFNPYRFDNYYFLIELDSLPQIKIDVRELESYEWLNPVDFLGKFNKGKILTVKPILEISEKLSHSFNLKSFILTPIDESLCPIIEPVKGLKHVFVKSKTLPPATMTNSFIVGDQGKVILVDPSPNTKEELTHYIETVRSYSPTHIFITHHHGDHHEHSSLVAKELNLTFLMSELTYKYIIEKKGHDYFESEVIFTKHGEKITTSERQGVFVYDVPGHDLGQQALFREDLAWFIASDLFQGVGSVVVGGDKASMKLYMETLNNVIKLNPKVLLPSHGIALGGTYILEKNLKHRLYREEQIKNLKSKNYSNEEILMALYSDIPESLQKYAMANIVAHLKKIEEE